MTDPGDIGPRALDDSGERVPRDLTRERSAARVSRSRSERRSSRLVARRRRRAMRLMRLVVPLVVLAVVAAVVVMVFPREESEGQLFDDAVSTDPSSTGAASNGAAPVGSIQPAGGTTAGPGLVVLVEHGGDLRAAVVLHPRAAASSQAAGAAAAVTAGQSGVALVAPPETLLSTGTAFKTVAQIWHGDIGAAAGTESAEPDRAETGTVLVEAFATVLGSRPAAVLTLGWSDVQQALAGVASAQDSTSGAIAQRDDADPEQMGSAVLSVLAAVDATGTEMWEEGSLGESGGVGDVVRDLSSRVKEGEWDVCLLPGMEVREADYSYYEPDPMRVRLAIAGGGLLTGATLAIQNGSGVVGAAEAAASLLLPLGYELQPFTNAPGFPDVETTIISTHPGGVAAAEEVRMLLGVGRVRQADGLREGELVVVVGKDLVVPHAADADSSAGDPQPVGGV